MKCVNCGADITEGSLYCNKCGKPIQIVPDYNEFDDYLDHLVGSDADDDDMPNLSGQSLNNYKNIDNNANKNANKNVDSNNVVSSNNLDDADIVSKQKLKAKETAASRKQQEKKKQQMKIILISSVVIVAVVIILLVAIAVNVSNSHDSSLDYQLKQAEEALAKGDYSEAATYYEKALSIDPNNIDVMWKLAQIYMDENDTDAAMVLYQEIISADSKNVKAYKALIALYDKKSDYDAILALKDSASDDVQSLFDAYTVSNPSFSENGGDYTNDLTIKLKVSGDAVIYYSFDDTDPIKNGDVYSEPIELEGEDEYTINAVAVDDRGIYSEVVTKEFNIEYENPEVPEIDPDGGTFGAQSSITITVPSGCDVYYTWDMSTPSAASTRYTEPIPIPEGNNVLSAIAINRTTGKCSDVYTSRFEFYLSDSDDVVQSE